MSAEIMCASVSANTSASIAMPYAAAALPIRTARAIVVALGLRHGPIHAEFRVNDKGVWPLEMAARSIGGLCGRVLRFSAGFSLEDLILRHALGLPATERRAEPRPGGVMMIPIPRAGTLRRGEMGQRHRG